MADGENMDEQIKIREIKTVQNRINLQALSKDNFDINNIQLWTRIHIKNPPKKRSCHSSFIYKKTYLYIVGGVDISEQKQGDIYKVDLNAEAPTWEKVELKSEKKLEKIAYHAGVLKDGIYYIFGGQDENLYSSNKIQRFNVEEETMLDPIEIDDTIFPCLESHTAVCDDASNKIYIYGGQSKKTYNLHVFEFDIEKQEIKNLTENTEVEKLPAPRAEHSAVLSNGIMYVFGGYGPDRVKYNDLWCFNLSDNSWSQVLFGDEEQEKKEAEEAAKAKLKEQEKEEPAKEEEKPEEQVKEEPKPKVNKPEKRCGHSMVLINNKIYIFGGKVDDILETNELWEYSIDDKKYTLVHDTMLEQFTQEELNSGIKRDDKGKKLFHWLTKADVEKKTNPIIMGSCNSLIKSSKKDKDEKAKKEASKNTKNINMNAPKKENNPEELEELKGKYHNQIMKRTNVVKMIKTLIYNSKTNDLGEIRKFFGEDKNKVDENISNIRGAVPDPRDGQTMNVYLDNKLVLFGGDRNKFPFSDTFLFDTTGISRVDKKSNE